MKKIKWVPTFSIIIILAIVAYLFFSGRIGFMGSGGSILGGGEGSSSKESISENLILIQVAKDEYLLDDEPISLTKIESLLAEKDSASEFQLEDNYGSAKAWDELKQLFIEYDIGYTEK